MDGILLIAVGNSIYGELAANCAASIRATNKHVPICLQSTESAIKTLNEAQKGLFSMIKEAPEHTYHTADGTRQYVKVKSHVYELSPFENTLFIDVDTVIKPNVDIAYLFNDCGKFIFTAHCYGSGDIQTGLKKGRANLWVEGAGAAKKIGNYYGLKKGKIPGINSTLLWFKKNEKTALFAQKVREIYDNYPKKIAQGWRDGAPDEFCYNVACALMNIYPHRWEWSPFYITAMESKKDPVKKIMNYNGVSMVGSDHENAIKVHNQWIKECEHKLGVPLYAYRNKEAVINGDNFKKKNIHFSIVQKMAKNNSGINHPLAPKKWVTIEPHHCDMYDVFALFALNTPDETRAVEVGTFAGASAVLMAEIYESLGKKLRLDSIDIHTGGSGLPVESVDFLDAHGGSSYEVAKANIERTGYKDVVNLILKDSIEAAKDYADESLDLVYLDGDHDLKRVRGELNVWYHKVKPGGWIGGHDYEPNFRGVITAVDRFAFAENLKILVNHRSWYVQKPLNYKPKNAKNENKADDKTNENAKTGGEKNATSFKEQGFNQQGKASLLVENMSNESKSAGEPKIEGKAFEVSPLISAVADSKKEKAKKDA